MDRNTILFGGTDPGRFCPTYMIFCESFIPPTVPAGAGPEIRPPRLFISSPKTRWRTAPIWITSARNISAASSMTRRFSAGFSDTWRRLGIGNSDNVVKEVNNVDAGKGDTRELAREGIASLLDKTLDQPFTAWGEHVEKRRRAEGVYPPKEIYIPSNQDSQECFTNTQRGETNCRQAPNGRMQVSGQVAVMKINGLLCRSFSTTTPPINSTSRKVSRSTGCIPTRRRSASS